MRALIKRSRVLLTLTVLTLVAVAYNFSHTASSQTAGGKIMSMQTASAQADPPAVAVANPLLAKWEGPYGGVPPFDKVQVAQFKPALEAAMAENLAEVDQIAKDSAAPNFR